jgi:nitronate monooxygenase
MRTPWLENDLKYLPEMQAVAHEKPRCTLKFACLRRCGLRDSVPKIGQFCIHQKLAEGLLGDAAKGQFFRARQPSRSGARYVRYANPPPTCSRRARPTSATA